LPENSVIRNFRITAADGKTDHYRLSAVLTAIALAEVEALAKEDVPQSGTKEEASAKEERKTKLSAKRVG